LGATHERFSPQADAFQDRYRVIRPDLRGNGLSGSLVGPIGAILNPHFDDIALLLNQLGVNRAAIIGVSHGGSVALHFALLHPDRLAGLVVVDSFAELRMSRPMEALLLAGSYFTVWTFFLPRPLGELLLRLVYRRWPTFLAAIAALVEGNRPTEAVLKSWAMLAIPNSRLEVVRNSFDLTNFC
jgi:3-oxoadipate enol-lactonase